MLPTYRDEYDAAESNGKALSLSRPGYFLLHTNTYATHGSLELCHILE